MRASKGRGPCFEKSGHPGKAGKVERDAASTMPAEMEPTARVGEVVVTPVASF